MIWAAANGREGTVEILPGDPSAVVAEVTKWKPNPVAPVVPAGTDVIAGPKLGQ